MKEVAVVTGASYGIGSEICKKLSSDGYHVIAVARSLDRIKDLSENNDGIDYYELDITDEIGVQKFITYLNDKNVSLLVNNAGGGASNLEIIKDSTDIWKYAYSLNVLAPMNLSSKIAPLMIKNKKGHIVIITSTCGHFVYHGGGGYTVAKHAEVALAELLRMEMIPHGIRVTEIAPGNVNSRKQENMYGMLDPEDIAESVRWVASLPEHVNVESMKILHVKNPIR